MWHSCAQIEPTIYPPIQFWILIILVEFVIMIFGIWFVWSAMVGAPWLPTPKKRVRAMLKLAEVSEGDVLYDLGSGDGRIIVMAAKEFGANAIGIEIDPLRLLWTRFVIWRHKLHQKAEVIRGNFFHINLENASVVTIYQGHEINKKIREKLSTDLGKGTRVVSYRFIIAGWTPVSVDNDSSLYLYEV